MRALHAGEIDCFARRLFLSRVAQWLGVYARDELPDLNHQHRPFALVLNTDPHDKPGQHWLAMYAPPSGPIELFDSFGFMPEFYGFDNLNYKYSSLQLQPDSSNTCGYYCLFFIERRSSNLSFNQVVSLAQVNGEEGVIHRISNILNYLNSTHPCHRTGQCSVTKCSFCH